jgi:FMN reductase
MRAAADIQPDPHFAVVASWALKPIGRFSFATIGTELTTKILRSIPLNRGETLSLKQGALVTNRDISVVVIAGSTRPKSSSEIAAHLAGASAESAGARVTYITGRDLILPIYDTETRQRTEQARFLVDAVRTSHGIVLASPGYHGGVSGMIKNALDYMEDLAAEDPPYLEGRAVGCIGVAYGWQATVSTLQQLRQIAHALRAWPTPLGVSVNAIATKFAPDGTTDDEVTATQLQTIGQQVVDFATRQRADRMNLPPSI